MVETLIVILVNVGAGEAPGDSPADGLLEGTGDGLAEGLAEGLADGLGDGALDGEADGEALGETDDAAEADGGGAAEETAGLAVVAGGELAVGEVAVDAQAAAIKVIINTRDTIIICFLNIQFFISNLHILFYLIFINIDDSI